MTVLAAAYVNYDALPVVNDLRFASASKPAGSDHRGRLGEDRPCYVDRRASRIHRRHRIPACSGSRGSISSGSWPRRVSRCRVTPARCVRRPHRYAAAPLVALTPAGWVDFTWVFPKTGLFSFGVAYGSIAFLRQVEAVAERGWLTASQLLDGVALSVATPGPIMLPATFVGFVAAGVPGAIVATVAVFLPSFVVILVLARWIELRARPTVLPRRDRGALRCCRCGDPLGSRSSSPAWQRTDPR